MAITTSNHLLVSSWANSTGKITVALTAFTDTSAGEGFTTSLITAWPNCGIVGAGVSGDLHTTFTAAVSGTAATTAAAAGTTVTAANWAWGNVVCDTNSSGTTLVGTFPSAITAGDAITLAIWCERTVSISSIVDSAGNTYQLKNTGTPSSVSAVTYTYVAMNVAGSSAGGNTITVTFSANPFTSGNGAGAVVEAWEDTPSVGKILVFDAAASVVGTGTGTALSSGSFSTTYVSEVVHVFCSAESQITAASGGSWTASGQNPYLQQSEFQVFSVKQSGISATLTAAGSTPWAVVTVGLGEIASVGWVSSDIDARVRGRSAITEDPPADAKQASAALPSVGWQSVDVSARGAGRAVVPEEFPRDVRTASSALSSLGWQGVEIASARRNRSPDGSDSGATQLEPFTNASLFEEPLVARRRSPQVATDDLPANATKPLPHLGFLQSDVDQRGRGRVALPEEFAVKQTQGVHSHSWLPIDSEARGKGRAALTEDTLVRVTSSPALASAGWYESDATRPARRPTAVGTDDLPVDATKPLPTGGWLPGDVDIRGRARVAIPDEFPSQQAKGLHSHSWLPIDVEARGRGRAPALDDFPTDPRQSSALASAGWYEGEALRPARRPGALEHEQPADATKPLPHLGFLPSDVEPRGRGRTAIPEEGTVEKLNAAPVLASMAAWAPLDPFPRPRERRFPDPETNANVTHALAAIGWAQVDVDARARGRAQSTDDALLDARSAIAGIGWAPSDIDGRRRGRTPTTDETPFAARPAVASIGWATSDVDSRRVRAIPDEPFVARALSTAPLPSIGWYDVDYRGRARPPAPVPEEFPVHARQTGISESIGWMSFEPDPRGRGRAAIPDDLPITAMYATSSAPLCLTLDSSEVLSLSLWSNLCESC